MRSNSDDSDYEDENFEDHADNIKTRMEAAYQDYLPEESDERERKKKNDSASNFTMEKETSDSNDSSYDGNYFQNLNQDEPNVKFRSTDMYQDLSYEQDSNDEYAHQDAHFDNIHTAATSYNEENTSFSQKTTYQDSSDECESDFGSRDRFTEPQEDASFSKEKTNYTNYDTSKPKKRRHADSHSANPENSKKKRKLEKLTQDDNSCENANTGSQSQEKLSTFDAGDKAMRMMKKMGYEQGHGLGKNKQGRLEPVEAAKQRGYSGLGFRNRGLEEASLKWNSAEEEIKAIEILEWLENTLPCAPTEDEMKDWIQLGPKKETVDDETNFCDAHIVKNIVKSKSVFDTLDKVEMRRATTRSNPYETIRGAFFLNRAAVKMANMDKACDFMFTNPPDMKPNELLYFADVCAGPGGFSEYVLWRKKWHAKGFGFTLKDKNDFKLSDFYAGPCETFYPFYGPKDNGDVFDPSNQAAFRDLIMRHTNGEGVHFMMSDGGFSVEGQENIQEILSKQLYLCQCLVALMVVRTRGNFVTKLFDLFTPFSAGLVYLMYRCFDKICIFKPNTSRPANSERYLICKGKRPDTEDVLRHLLRANHLILTRDDFTDVMELVPLNFLKAQEEFMYYLKSSNETLGRKQITGLLKIAAFCEDRTLIEQRQADMRKQCLEYWEIPDQTRTIPKHTTPQDRLKSLLKNANFLSLEPTKLTKDNITKTILEHPRDWFFVASGSGRYSDKKLPTFYMGMGRRNIYRYENYCWKREDINLELPPDTLVYAELVYECTNEYRNQQKVLALHILDAYFLGGEDVSQKYIETRHELIKKFCKALWKPSATTRIRAKDLYPLDPGINEKLKVRERLMKNNQRALAYDLPKTPLDYGSTNNDVTPYFVPSSVLFFKSTADTWSRHFSKTYSATYVFNCKTNEKKYDTQRPAAAEAGFIESFKSCCIWYWPNDEILSMNTVVELLKQSFKT